MDSIGPILVFLAENGTLGIFSGTNRLLGELFGKGHGSNYIYGQVHSRALSDLSVFWYSVLNFAAKF